MITTTKACLIFAAYGHEKEVTAKPGKHSARGGGAFKRDPHYQELLCYPSFCDIVLASSYYSKGVYQRSNAPNEGLGGMK